jgi:hypothetical protein
MHPANGVLVIQYVALDLNIQPAENQPKTLAATVSRLDIVFSRTIGIEIRMADMPLP